MYTTIRIFVLAMALLLSACGEYSTELPNTTSSTPSPTPGPTPGPTPTTCLQEFQTVVYPILDVDLPAPDDRCKNCHTPSNLGASVFNMLANDATAFALFSETAMKTDANGMSLVLVKPLGFEQHGGGNLFPNGTDVLDYIAIQTLVDKIVSGQCQ